jgi:hypothetical protein
LADKPTGLVIPVNLPQNAPPAREPGRPPRKQITLRIRRAGAGAVSITEEERGKSRYCERPNFFSSSR